MENVHTWSPETTAKRMEELEERIRRNDPKLKYVFTQTFFEAAKDQVKGFQEHSGSDLCGAIVSVKDLLDVKGYVTKAGTQFMRENTPASEDALAIRKLRDAGVVFIGHTNMTELAYSGLGLNPHYGTPQNALSKGCIPGGSTSGGAVSVACGAADIAIGTDTGGSLRIPAAFNGIVGFKPSQNTVSREGCKALSRSLDSIGPMARTVAACKLAYKAMTTGQVERAPGFEADFVIPTNYGMHDLEPEVASLFGRAVETLVENGCNVQEKSIAALEALKSFPAWQFSSIESRAEYEEPYRTMHDLIDPRVAGSIRMGRADEVSAIEYRQTLNLRQNLIQKFRDEMGSSVLLMPTVPILPPSFASMESDEEYSRVNLQVLRNPSIANIMDGCSISLPFQYDGKTTGVMLTACGGSDLELLELAEKLEGMF